MEGKGSLFNIVLLIILAFLSLTVCALAGYVFFGMSSSKAPSSSTTTQQVVIKVPKDSELLDESVFGTEDKLYNLKKLNSNEIAIIKVSVKLKYMKSVKGIKNTTEKLTTFDSEIKSLIGTYFMNMTTAEAADTKTKTEVAPKYLKTEINKLLVENEKVKKDIVYEVIFEDWFYQ